MTQQRRDNHSTEFGIWLRQQPEIDSARGFITTNVDYVWTNYLTGEWMTVEEKRYGRVPARNQSQQFARIDNACRSDDKYRGFHLLVFENTRPDDGGIWLDGKHITRDDLITFLTFAKGEDWYQSYAIPQNIVRIGFNRAAT